MIEGFSDCSRGVLTSPGHEVAQKPVVYDVCHPAGLSVNDAFRGIGRIAGNINALVCIKHILLLGFLEPCLLSGERSGTGLDEIRIDTHALSCSFLVQAPHVHFGVDVHEPSDCSAGGIVVGFYRLLRRGDLLREPLIVVKPLHVFPESIVVLTVFRRMYGLAVAPCPVRLGIDSREGFLRPDGHHTDLRHVDDLVQGLQGAS